MTMLVLCDHDRGTLVDASLEALTFGRDLATRAGVSCEAVVIGKGAEEAAGQLAAYGATVVHLAYHEVLTDFGPEAWGETLAQLVASSGASTVTACGTDRGNEVLAHVAARLDEPFVANCREVDPSDDTWSMTRARGGVPSWRTSRWRRVARSFPWHTMPSRLLRRRNLPSEPSPPSPRTLMPHSPGRS